MLPVRDPKLLLHAGLLMALLAALGLAHEVVNPWLRFDRAGLDQGQAWRLVTGHLVHLGPGHLGLNLAGLALILWFFRDLLDRRRLWVWLAVSSLITGLALYLLDPELGWYVGLSGLLQGLLVFCLLIGWRGHPWLHSLVLALVVGRLLYEQWPGYDANYLRGLIDGRVYVNAHLYGALSGLLLALSTGFAKLGAGALAPASRSQDDSRS